MSESAGVAARQNLLEVLGHLAEEKAPRSDAQMLQDFTVADQRQRAEFCERYALHPSFVTLVSGLTQVCVGRNSPEYWPTYRRLIACVADDTDTWKVAGGWISDVWEQVLRGRISNAELRSACDHVGDLHRRAGAGETVSRQDWRAARKAIEASAVKVGGDDALWARVIAAGAWDAGLVPAAGGDVLQAWCELALQYCRGNGAQQEDEKFKANVHQGAKFLSEVKSQGIALLAERGARLKG